MSIKTFKQLIDFVKECPPVSVAVAGGADLNVLASLKQARKIGFVDKCYLAGPEEDVKRAVSQSGDDPALYHILASYSDAEMSGKAVKTVKNKKAGILIKGTVKSEMYFRAILDSENGIRVSPVLSNMSLFEMPSISGFLGVTDNAILINPGLQDKAAAIKNTAPLWKAFGICPVRVAAVAAVETVNPKMQATVDAAALSIMSARGQLPGFIVEGPLGYDAAISAECAKAKKLGDSEVCGRPNLILAPNLEAANSLGKSYKLHGNAAWGGLVFGASVPAVLNSRSDSGDNRLKSLAMARAVAMENCR